jgi:hypothetical protein
VVSTLIAKRPGRRRGPISRRHVTVRPVVVHEHPDPVQGTQAGLPKSPARSGVRDRLVSPLGRRCPLFATLDRMPKTVRSR